MTANIKDIYALSPTQRGMLFHTLYSPDSGVYVVSYSCMFQGAMDFALFEKAWNKVIERHDILRTGFVWEDIEKPVQVVYDQLPVSVEQYDWRDLTEDQQQEQFNAYFRENRSKGFHLSEAPLLRLALIQLQDNSYQFVWLFHHILLDGWSISIVMGEVFAFYGAFIKGKNLRLPGVRPYRDYIAWNQKQDVQQAEQFWRNLLQGVGAPTSLPPSRNKGDSGYEEVGTALSVQVTNELRNLARQHQLTLNTFVQGAWGLLLSRYTREQDVIFGATVSGRPANLPGVESMVGLFINTLPVRVNAAPQMDVITYLKQLQELQASIRDYEYCPLSDVQAWSEIARGHSLFESIVVFENYPIQQTKEEERGLLDMITSIHSEEQTNYPITISVVPGDFLELSISYDRSKFDKDMIQQIITNLHTVLEAIAASPTQTLASIPTLTPEEREHVLAISAGEVVNYDAVGCVHQLVQAQAVRTPDAVALISGSVSMTYRELDCQANQVAAYLRQLGAGPGKLVGLFCDRSIDLALALLGVLKAGAAYVPIDPAYPQERIAYMIHDAQMSFLLTKADLASQLPAHDAAVICLDADREAIFAQPADELEVEATGELSAYVIYTSGSTGAPKGVVIPHRAMRNHNLSAAAHFELTAADRVLQFATISFDAAVEEFFPTWIRGAALVMMPDRLMSPAECCHLAEQHHITVLNLPTAYWHEWVNEMVDGTISMPATVRAVIVGGERPSPERFAQWRRMTGHQVAWYNTYGPTEATVSCTVFRAPDAGPDDEPIYEEIPIGRPIANTYIYILDENKELTPIGVPGEMYIGGAGLAQGYLHRLELTAERFVASPFQEGERLYRTGDIGRYLHDGQLEYLGRVDFQVKIRGFRIELEEIEIALLRHPKVRNAVTIARADKRGDNRLVAYVVSREEETISDGELRHYLVERLPAYMVPAVILTLPELPLTPSGKVDRKALPTPDFSQLGREQEYVRPRNVIEESLCRVWSEVLGVDHVGIYDNFFELGGDSILSIQVVSRAAQAGLSLSPRHIFEHRTISELSGVVKSAVVSVNEQGVVTGPVPLTPIQHWFLEQEITNRHHWNQAMFLTIEQPVHADAMEQAIARLIEHHDALRMNYTLKNSTWTQHNGDQLEKIPFERVDLSHVPQDEQRAVLEYKAEEYHQSLSLNGSLMRAVLFDLGRHERARLLIAIHHLVVDGISWRILLEDLQSAYEALVRGDQAVLPPKTTSFKQWAEGLVSYVQSGALLQEVDYWVKSSPVQVAALPTDYELGSRTDKLMNTEASTTTVAVELSEAETHALLREVPSAYRTQINDVLVTALAQTIADWTKSGTVAIDMEGHGREELMDGIDLSRTVGWFTSVYPVYLDMDRTAATRLGDAIMRVKERLAAIPNNGIGYGLLRYLGDEANRGPLRNLPQATISFNYLGQMNQQKSGDGEGIFGFAAEASGSVLHEANKRAYLLDINAMIVGGKLHMTWAYSSDLYKSETIEKLAGEYVAALRALIAHCLSAEAGRCTPSDFPLAALTQEQLDEQLANYRQTEDVYLISPMQEGMLFHTVYSPGSQQYFEQSSFALQGKLNDAAFEQAWQTVLDRHSILRTGFIWNGVDKPHQFVLRSPQVPFERQDWQGLGEEEQAIQWEKFLEQDRERLFDLAAPPLIRLTLIRLGAEQYKFVWSFHHILLDGWSVPTLLGEVLSSYYSLVQGKEIQLNPISSSYRDYIAWLQRQDMQAAESYWREQLRGFTAPTALPLERRKGEQKEMGEASVSYTLDAKAAARLQAMARHYELTLSTLIQGAWAILLSRYANEEDVLFGTTVAGRPTELPDFESMVGLFINSLPVRVAVNEDQSVQQWLKQLNKQMVDIRQFEYSPLVQVQGWSDVPNGTPLFDSLVVFQNYPVQDVLEQDNPDALQLHSFRTFEQTNFPVTLVAIPGEELLLQALFDPKLYTSTSVERMLRHLGTLLQEMANRPAQKIGNLQLLSEQERTRTLMEWNSTQAAFPLDRSVGEWFAEQARLEPDAVAIVFGEQSVTYGELNRMAERLARSLIRSDVASGDIVAICMERSIESVAGMLAIWKAGGAYLPLDSTYPQERMAYMLSEAQVKVLMTQERVRDQLPAFQWRIVVCDHELQAEVTEAAESTEELQLPEAAGVDKLAYVIFTSGSTGQPKGVEITHRSLLNLIGWHRQTYDVQAADRATMLAGVAFDASVWELWPYVTAGASIYIADEETRLNPVALRDWLLANEITLSFIPTPLAEPMLTLEWPEGCKLRAILTGGDRLAQYPPDTLPFALYNHYGPSESTVVATACRVPAQSGKSSAEIAPSIGRPIANTRVYILDRKLRPLPQGVPGEMYIGGEGLARGYTNRPELMAGRFIDSPFVRGERLYRTGDLARHLPSGDIEFLGRNDDQVKIRGYRIELGEIHAVIAEHAAVREASVIVREDRPGDKRLVAYLVLHKTQQVEQHDEAVQSVHSYLPERLPEYMVPIAFVTLDALPLTPNGKVDRKQLPAPAWDQMLNVSSYVAPRNEVERSLTSIWEDVLGLEQVGIYDNFFELGGDSILSIQVMSRAAREGIRLTPKMIFGHPTVAQLGEVAEWSERTVAEQGLVTGQAELTPIQQWFFEQPLGHRHHWNQAMLLTVQQPVHVQALEQTIQTLVAHHDGLRMRLAKEEGGWSQTNLGLDEAIMLATEDLSQLSESAQTEAITTISEAVQRSLHVEHGPLMRVVLFDLGANQPARLLLVIHHLVIDAVSWRILLEDIEEAYEQARQGIMPKLQPKTTSFQQWSKHLQQYAKSESMRKEAAYWLAMAERDIASLPVDSRLSDDDRRALNTADSFRTEAALLTEEETRALLQQVPAVYRTQINDVLLTALMLAMHQFTGQSSMLIHMEGHGREEIANGVDVSRTVGWFTSIYPIYLELASDTPPGEALRSIKEQLRQVPDRGLGYGVLRYLSEDEQLTAKLQSLPTPEISFNYLGQFQQQQREATSIFGVAVEDYGVVQNPTDPLAHLLDVAGVIAEGQLQLTMSYSSNLFREEAMHALMQQFAQSLRSLIAHCQSAEAGGFTPSDFPLARLSQVEIDRYLANTEQIEDAYGLAPAQEGMLFHSIYAPSSGVYIQQVSFTMQGRLDRQAWQQAWEMLCDQHPILRTAFLWEGMSEPHQVVYTRVTIPFTDLDWRGYEAEEQADLIAEFLQEDRVRGFALDEAPLMRMAMIRLSDDCCQFIWTFHHLLLDGWSIPIILGELATIYHARCSKQPIELTAGRPYRDYIAWLHKQDAHEAEKFWMDKLRGFTAPTQLSVERSQIAEAHGNKDVEHLLPQEVTCRLQQLARQHNVTLSTVVQGAWAILLYRYSGETNVVFGSTVAGRPADLQGAEHMVGLFINTLPVRVQVDPEGSVGDWLRRLQEQLVEQREYEYSPLVKIQGWSEVPRGMSLFESIVVFENYPVEPPAEQAGEGVVITSSETIDQTNYPLMVVAAPGDQFSLRIAYDTARYEDDTIIRMMGHLTTLLTGLAEDWSLAAVRLPMLTEAERSTLLPAEPVWTPPTDERCIHEWFEQQAALRPDKIAVVYGEHALTYVGLNEQANRLAHYLRKRGAGPETMVGLCMERSLDLVVSILGILKAGAAYVPLDPVYPTERLSFMLEDSETPLLLTHAQYQDTLPTDGVSIICLDAIQDELALEGGDNLGRTAAPDNLAYVIYTSGSTGKPKGVTVCHQHVVRLFTSTEAWYGFHEQDVWTLFHSYAFDFSVWEMWGALLYGGRLVVVPYYTSRSSEDFYRLLVEEQVTVLNQTPSAFRQLIRAEERIGAANLALRYVIFGGEALDLPALGPWFERHGDESPALVNMYGITETTVHVTYRPITMQDVQEASGSLIGKPIPDLQMYVLDSALQPVPIGVPGEMHIAGAGVTRGYLNRAELTAERFIPNPFSQDPEARMYKSGDLACWRANRELEYVGRADEQVKIRGFRIELGEIEAMLAQYPSVREVTVMARQDGEEDKRLVAYLSTDNADITVAGLRGHLASVLPEYMIPSAFVFMDTFPLTSNGKVDRKALPSPDVSRPELERSYIAPRNPTEEKVAAIWAEVMGIEQVGIEDNFFELGGHSLLATRLISRIRDEFQVEVPLAALFESPTVAALASAIQQAQEDQAGTAMLDELLEDLEGISEDELLQMLAEQAADKEND
ncbi:amino acid adenylation domain-containing protein [Paenibacillus sp. MER TA 81-3]|uniref:non-ribosomal peptide synthetase n=1 Tax=Paenibacillus sp. MER TA 81-3 TaxID=2939573 RepID=UPI00203CEB7C|nr:non-ribosomal peptide synthetase [Paenibacillus sp. MER TA 81-3]MCM3338070.1 amino acid adenylation domain-containing protein [Paenibacillus sp. MER TA 81-3]